MGDQDFDLIVIGSGPAGQKGAICAAKLRKRVAVIDRTVMMGGVCVHTGTIPSKSVREAIFQLTGSAVKSFYGNAYRGNGDISVKDLAFRVQSVVARETDVIRAQLKRNGVCIYQGMAHFVDPHTLEIQGESDKTVIRGEHVLIACGTRPAGNTDIPFDGKRVFDTDQINGLQGLPRELIVVGAGVVGLEYTSFMAAMGVEVTLIDQRPQLLDFVDREIIEALAYHLRQMGTTFRLGDKVTRVGFDEQRDRVFAELESGKKVQANALLYAVGRQANGDQLGLEAAGLQPDPRGKVIVNAEYQTTVPHIYAAGDVIGFPALASTSMEQGRLASCHMFGAPSQNMSALFPYGIYTIPEISMVGQTEEKLTEAKVPYEVGMAKYKELAKSMMLGDESGMLKLLFDRNTRKLLGVHAIGQRATEIIHIGQAVLAYGGSIEYFRDTVFNYPTLAEAYKVAALDGLNKL
ncbi:MAG TPA: Si-specific NAD(P)(+) transhydrogenase [Candidatus Dormibacteraeota bacterium]|jgi:NAD(P) transhydrogenase|nr:Si-specific NAD(P)(+) transhydrogenase [Candidatus Dormibacteraeota bacterium]